MRKSLKHKHRNGIRNVIGSKDYTNLKKKVHVFIHPVYGHDSHHGI